METFIGWLKTQDSSVNEANTRYSVEVNFRTRVEEVLEHYARITLGYVSAALKNFEYHVKQVFDDGVIRILVSTRNWDDGEWVVVVSWNPHHKCFFITKGFYNKLAKNVSYKQGSEVRTDSDNAAKITADVRNIMHELKGKKDRHIEKLKKVPLKTGPKG